MRARVKKRERGWMKMARCSICKKLKNNPIHIKPGMRYCAGQHEFIPVPSFYSTKKCVICGRKLSVIRARRNGVITCGWECSKTLRVTGGKLRYRPIILERAITKAELKLDYLYSELESAKKDYSKWRKRLDENG